MVSSGTLHVGIFIDDCWIDVVGLSTTTSSLLIALASGNAVVCVTVDVVPVQEPLNELDEEDDEDDDDDDDDDEEDDDAEDDAC